MDSTIDVAVMVGSLRRASLSRKVAAEVVERARGRLECHLLELGDLPLYNDDLECDAPDPWQRLRDEIRGCDAILFVTPEYNRSLPGLLKNAIDVGSRPQGKSVFDGKPAAVISQTPYQLGAFGANHALRQTFVYLNMPALQQPEMYLSGTAELFDAAGRLKAPDTIELFESFIDAFAAWIARVRAPAFSVVAAGEAKDRHRRPG